jgi:lipopolysaccharide biosynthesis regulator YciM
MDAQTLTIVSGIVLLIVFALVGWNIRRRSARRMPKGQRRNKNT